MYKISDKVIKFITNDIKKLESEINNWRHLLGRFAFSIIICNSNDVTHVFKKCTGGYKFTKSQENINPLIFIDDIKLFAKNEKELDTDTNN